MTSRDARRASVAPLLAELRSDLLVAPREEIVEKHLDMMAFEQSVLATPRFVDANKARGVMRQPRRAAVAFAAICATLVSCGLSAAGALPEPLQQITDTIAHTLGAPGTDHAQPAPEPDSSAGTPSAPAPTTTTMPRPAPSNAPQSHSSGSTTPPSTHPAISAAVLPPFTDPSTPIARTPVHPPAQPITPVNTDPPPSKNSSNTPPGYPTDWRTRAADGGAAQLSSCAQTNALQPAGCPQQLTVPDTAQVQSVRWTLLNTPQATAVVVAKTQNGNPAKHLRPKTTVTVYEAFQMSATYTAADGSGPYLGYSSGIAVATMTWNGSAFETVSFAVGSVANIPTGITAPTIPSSSAFFVQAAVLAELHSGFEVCTASTPVAGDPVPSCPQPTAPGAHWTLVGDPTQGATLAYDARTGLYTVTGDYAMTSDQGDSVSGPYTATLFVGETRVWVLNLSGT